MTQQDGASPPDGQPDPATQRERRWPPVADADWWRDGTTEYVPVRRPPSTPARDAASLDAASLDAASPDAPSRDAASYDAARDPEIDFELDGPGNLGAGTRSASAWAMGTGPEYTAAPEVPTATVEPGTTQATDASPGSAADAPADREAAEQLARGTDGTGVELPAEAMATVDGPDDAGPTDDRAELESTGIGRAASPYARPPRVSRREVAPAPRRVLSIPPAIITAPTPPEFGGLESVGLESEGFESEGFESTGFESAGFESTVERRPTEPESVGLSLFDMTAVGAVPAVPRPRRQPAPPPVTGRRKRFRRRRPGRAWIGLPALLVLLFAAAFLAWVSAEPFWLDTGHGTAGTATVVARTDRCQVTFAAAGFTTSTVDLAGARLDQCAVGAAIPAQMVSPDAARAYAVDRTGLRLRWAVGLAGLLLLGWGVAWATGAARFRGLQRIVAIALSLAAPLFIAATMLAVTY